jgi:addiction module HigA family antidote
MSISNSMKINRRPTHPDEILREDFLPDFGLAVTGLAEALGVSRQSINELVWERRRVSPEMALPAVWQLVGVLAKYSTGCGAVGCRPEIQ